MLNCNDRENKLQLQWANEDTLIYWDNNDFHLYGIDITNVDAIREKKDNLIPSDYGLSCYPNPFNPSTTIEIKLPHNINGVLSIYNIQGKLIKEYRIENDGRQNYKIIWNAVNSRNEGVASGIYLAVLRRDDNSSKNRKVIKLIFLK